MIKEIISEEKIGTTVDKLCESDCEVILNAINSVSVPENALSYHKRPEFISEDLLDSDAGLDSDSISTTSRYSRTASTSLTSLGVSPKRAGKREATVDVNVDLCKSHIDGLIESDYLLFIQPHPILPPPYEDLPPGGCPKYPIVDNPCGNEQLPKYTAAAFKFGIVQRKQEWVSPYDISSNRSWKNVVMELNSTQLNIYVVSALLEKVLLQFNSSFMDETESGTTNITPGSPISSIITNNRDVKLYSICERNGLSNFEFAEGRRVASRKSFLNNSSIHLRLQSTSSKSNKHQLIRSYSLQHAKFGLANDYTKKPNVLRLRLENEQFLIHFSTTKELIEWHLGMSIGKDVALDIAEREAPKYRTVPRRRRHTLLSSFLNLSEAMMRRNRSQSEPVPSTKSLKPRLSLGVLILKSFNSKTSTTDQPCSAIVPEVEQPTHHDKAFGQEKNPKALYRNEKSSLLPELSESTCERWQENAINHSATARASPCHLGRTSEEFQQSEEEYEDEVDEDSDADDTEINNREGSIHAQYSKPTSTEPDDAKWDPAYKVESRRRFIRNCLKCIRPLGFDDKWQNKLLVKPATITPLISQYVMSSSSILCTDGHTNLQCQKDRSGSTKKTWLSSSSKQEYFGTSDGLKISSMKLNKTPGHSLQEYVVGSHALLPKTS